MSKPAEQLGLALNLESLIQIQSQLATEINRDIESPNASKFHYAIPRMKNTLLSMEQVSDVFPTLRGTRLGAASDTCEPAALVASSV